MADTAQLVRSLRQEILFARQRIYEMGEPTPLQEVVVDGFELFVKREDVSPINAYKWRGACNRMALLDDAERARGVATASAGNHAQGVALAAKRLGVRATIFMPLSTPKMKQVAVLAHGGDWVEIQLVGDTYDAASSMAREYARENELTYIHAYDDLAVMAGQGTLADEVVMSGKGPFDVVFLQVGGGGMAAAVATWLKFQFPDIEVIGVEGENQASMMAAIEADMPVELDRVDVFCDGTAVRKVGELTFPVCREVIDTWVTVTNDEVSAGIQFLWEKLRCIPEPSGAMGIAAVLKKRNELQGKRVLTILCGANMDFELLATISRRAAIGAAQRRHLRIDIKEEQGAMFALLDAIPDQVNIVDFQYGKTHDVDASPVIGFEVSETAFEALCNNLNQYGFEFLEVTAETDVGLRMIPYEASLMKHPYFLTLEFHERPGALGDFLKEVSPYANLCYFNYVYSGERVGRALLGFEFDTADQCEQFGDVLDSAKAAYRSYEPVSPAVLKRILG